MMVVTMAVVMMVVCEGGSEHDVGVGAEARRVGQICVAQEDVNVVRIVAHSLGRQPTVSEQ